MLRHWLVSNGKTIDSETAYISTSDDVSGSQLEQIINGVRKLEWKLEHVFVLEKASGGKAYKTLQQFICENIS